MRWLKRTSAAVAVIAAVSLSLVVSAAPAQAWQVPAPPAPPPRISAPAPTTFKAPTTAVNPKSILTKVPIIGLSTLLDETLLPWLQSISGNSSNPSLGCVTGDGKFLKGAATCDAGTGEKKQTAGPNGLVVPDLLWGAMTGKNLNPLIDGAAPSNWSVSQLKPSFTAPANAKPGWVSISFTGVQGQLCKDHPTWHSCGPGWQSDIGWANSQWKTKIRCKVTSNGGYVGGWNGSGNNSLGTTGGMGNMQVAAKDYQVCKDDGSQQVDYVKGLAVNAAYEFAPSWAPSTYMNPNVDVYKDTTFTANLTCKNSAGNTVTVTKSGGTGTGIVPTAECPAGYLPDSGNTSVGNAFLDAPQKIEEWKILPETREAYNECIGWQSAGCIMRVQLDGVDCNPGNPACYDWGEIYRLTPSRIKCMWGNYEIDISNCLPLRNSYQSEGGVSALSSAAPGAAPVARDVFGNPVQPNADPASPPSWQPDYGTPTNPAPTTGGFPTTAPIPQTGTPPVSGTPPATQPPPVGTQTTIDDVQCWPSGAAAWNPLEWVLQPVKCALNWAFVPKKDVQARANAAQNAFKDKAPMNWFVGGGALVAGGAALGSAGCPDWVIHVEGFSENVVCDSSFTHAIVNSRGMLFGGMVIAMFWPLIRALWYSVIPIFRPSPAQ